MVSIMAIPLFKTFDTIVTVFKVGNLHSKLRHDTCVNPT